MGQTILALIIGFILGGLILWIFISKSEEDKGSAESFVMLQEQLMDIRNTLDIKLGAVTSSTQQQYSESAKIIREVTERLVELDKTNKQVVDFADQLKSLQNILRNPQQRGILGEYYLETVLRNVLPPNHYQMQYKFNDGEVVDAVIFLDKNKILPVDSKFSLENYNRMLNENSQPEKERLEKLFKQDLKGRIDETSKYIRPSEGTMDFAFMFIPAEAIYYDLLINQIGAAKATTRDLIEYAFQQKHVIIVSPTSFLAYLQTVLQGLRALQIEESAKEIRKWVEKLGRHLKAYDESMMRLGKNLNTTVTTYNKSYKEFKKIDKDVLRITGEAIGIEPQELEKIEEG